MIVSNGSKVEEIKYYQGLFTHDNKNVKGKAVDIAKKKETQQAYTEDKKTEENSTKSKVFGFLLEKAVEALMGAIAK